MATILIGPSGAGKSTFSVGAIVASADDFFVKGGSYMFDPSRLSDAHAACLRAWIEGLSHGHVVCDNTNTTVVEVAPYIATARAFGHEPGIVVFVAAHGQAPALAARNKHGVPESVIRGQIARIEKLLGEWPPFWPRPLIVHVET